MMITLSQTEYPDGFKPVKPQADNDTLANQGERLLLYLRKESFEMRIVPAGIIHAGWVIGLRTFKNGACDPAKIRLATVLN